MILDAALDESAALSDALQKIENYSFQNIKHLPLKISNCTISCFTSKPISLTIESLKEYVVSHPVAENIKISKKSLGKNCLILKIVTQNKNIAIKLFLNGSIHITGVTKPCEAVSISDFFCTYFSKMEEEKEEERHTLRYTINMIQSTFSIVNTKILLSDVKSRWECEDTQIINNEKHAACQIRFTKINTSVFIFSTGKIMITGAKNADHLYTCFETVGRFLDQNQALVCMAFEPQAKEPKKRGRKRKLEQDDFYAKIMQNI